MAKPNSQVHSTTKAEATIMAAIDIVVNNSQADMQSRVNFDFLRDYMVASLQTKFKNAGIRSYTESACECVYLEGHYYARRNWKRKKCTKTPTGTF